MQENIHYKHILYTMQTLSHKKQVLPKDMLGRSLAYNCFLPRLSNKISLYDSLQRTNTPKKAIHTNAEKLSKVMQHSHLLPNVEFDKEVACVLFSDCDTILNEDSMDYLSMIRRMSPAFIIHDSIFIDEYQILESAISGADMIVLDMQYLQAYLKCIRVLENNPMYLDSNFNDIISLVAQHSRTIHTAHSLKAHADALTSFAYNLGITPILRIESTNDVEIFHSLTALPYCFYTTKDYATLLPEESIIFTHNDTINKEDLTSHTFFDVLVVNE